MWQHNYLVVIILAIFYFDLKLTSEVINWIQVSLYLMLEQSYWFPITFWCVSNLGYNSWILFNILLLITTVGMNVVVTSKFDTNIFFAARVRRQRVRSWTARARARSDLQHELRLAVGVWQRLGEGRTPPPFDLGWGCLQKAPPEQRKIDFTPGHPKVHQEAGGNPRNCPSWRKANENSRHWLKEAWWVSSWGYGLHPRPQMTGSRGTGSPTWSKV